MIRVKFKQWNCVAIFEIYGNRRTAIKLRDEATREPIATASVNLPAIVVLENEIAIKDYAENEGMVKALQEAEIIGEQIYTVKSGYIDIGIYELLKTE